MHFDGPAGSQVPERVARAVTDVLLHCNANEGGVFEASGRTEALWRDARHVFATFLGASDPDCVITGPSMTSLTFTMARSLAQTWRAGDEIVVTDLEHDANVSPWLYAAEAAGVTVRRVGFSKPETRLDLDELERVLSPRTRLVALSYASNATGTVNPIREVVKRAHGVGALVYVDAVHYAPHGSIDVAALGCDFLVCSAYKFFGPHISMLWGRRALLESLPAEKVRPASATLPTKWIQGTPPFEAIAGAAEGIRYIADLARTPEDQGALRPALERSYQAILSHEHTLMTRLLRGLGSLPGVRIWGITDPEAFAERVPTVSLTTDSHSTKDLAIHLAEAGIFVWSGHHYAVPVIERLGLGASGTLRIGLLHYNTAAEVDRCLEVLEGALRR